MNRRNFGRNRIVPLAAALAAALLVGMQGRPPAISPASGASGTSEAPSDASPRKIWVYFTDHGESSARDLQRVVETAPLSERSLSRRQVRGTALYDIHDVPVNSGYLARIRDTGCTLKRTSKYLNAVSVVATASEIAAIRRLPFVAKIEPVRSYRRENSVRFEEDLAPDQSSEGKEPTRPSGVDYGGSYAQLDQINVIPLHENNKHGEGVMVGIFDTGFNRGHESLIHLDVEAEWDFVYDDSVTRNQPGQDVYNQHNHGTYCLSALAGYAPGHLIGPAWAATFVLAKTERQFEEVQGEEDDYVRALEWADSIGVDVVSTSLGYFNWYVWSDMDGNTAVTTKACDIAASKGITIVTAAGNERTTSWKHIIAPSDGDSVIAVGAVDLNGTIASFSSPGPTYDGRIKPDVVARGVSTWCASPYDSLTYNGISGTSLSTPLVGGACALLLQMHPSWGPMDVLTALRDNASKWDNPDTLYGWGIIDAYQSGLGGATAVSESVALALSREGDTVRGTIQNNSALSLVVDVARHGSLPTGGGWDAHVTVARDIVVPGLSSSTFSDRIDDLSVYEYRAQLSDDASHFSAWFTVPVGLALGQNAPNPFYLGGASETSIPYSIAGMPSGPGGQASLSSYTDVKLEVFDVRGARVRTLIDTILPPGAYRAPWDATDDRSTPVASGVYFYRLTAGGQQATRKMVLIRR